ATVQQGADEAGHEPHEDPGAEVAGGGVIDVCDRTVPGDGADPDQGDRGGQPQAGAPAPTLAEAAAHGAHREREGAGCEAQQGAGDPGGQAVIVGCLMGYV